MNPILKDRTLLVGSISAVFVSVVTIILAVYDQELWLACFFINLALFISSVSRANQLYRQTKLNMQYNN
ncbi:hypothetical protein [Aquibacillus rhizosphaerae]|uniref:Uncharacterized protein n=1 Tax=Aquibacillus rhizosphaerae TaxID=3051431 RepID=A0ABT7LD52_9BACI|nr:hypothetical protein [Aquibacillus sp. LR5S19]MDL4843110.1 hypothetical protein [Aquibacillus sp. LR5S19]